MREGADWFGGKNINATWGGEGRGGYCGGNALRWQRRGKSSSS